MSIIIKGGSSGDLATVKPASTAPIATDTSLVVTMSPNSPAQSVSGTVTANAGTNLNTSLLALEAGGNLATVKTNTDNLALAQASSTSGQKGNLILGAVTTAAPSYTTAQSNPLSLTTAGALRIDGSAVTQPISGTVTVNALTNASVVKAQLQDNSGNGIGSISSAGINNLAIALGATNYVASTVNSSTAQLAASATFTGTVETTFNQQSYSILMVSDQPMTINLFQYIDAGGTKLASTLTYTVLVLMQK